MDMLRQTRDLVKQGETPACNKDIIEEDMVRQNMEKQRKDMGKHKGHCELRGGCNQTE